MIEVIHYEKANKNKIIGYVDIKIPKWNNMIIRKIAHLQSGDRRWFSLPTFSRDKPDGTPNFFKYWSFEFDAYNAQLLDTLPEKVKEFCEKNNIYETPPVDFSKPLSSDEAFAF